MYVNQAGHTFLAFATPPVSRAKTGSRRKKPANYTTPALSP